jgi:undecaprenyl-diphosphatase
MNSFFDRILDLDFGLFLRINRDMANPLFDWLMPLLRDAYFWAPLYAFFAAFLLYNYKLKGLYVILFTVIAFAISDQISAHFLKFLVERHRPCAEPALLPYMLARVPCGSGFSFPSSHATNHFAISVFLYVMMPRRMRWVRPFVLIWAATVCFAQVYVGVHYPLDVTFGALLGTLIGLFAAYLCRLITHTDLNETDENPLTDNSETTADTSL